MYHSNDVAFSAIVYVFLMKMVGKKLEVMVYYYLFASYTVFHCSTLLEVRDFLLHER